MASRVDVGVGGTIFGGAAGRQPADPSAIRSGSMTDRGGADGGPPLPAYGVILTAVGCWSRERELPQARTLPALTPRRAPLSSRRTFPPRFWRRQDHPAGTRIHRPRLSRR